MSLFQFTDYREYLRHYVESLPKKGRGELTRIANHLSVNTTLLSQILAGTRDFSVEQAYELCRYLGHTEIELEYFVLLLQIERAGTQALKLHLQKKLENMRKEAMKLTNRVSSEKTMSEEERAVFYSSWIYSAVHLFTSVDPEGVSADEVAERFSLKRSKASEILQFLVQAGLCTEMNGSYKMTVQSTFLGQGSPHLVKHHANWRMKAIQKAEKLDETEMMFTGQVSVSKDDFFAIREKLIEFVKSAAERVKDSKPDDLACLNIDWFWIER